MNRQVSNKNILNDFCIRFCKVVEKHAKYIIVSGFLAIASGRIRGTEDIDMIMEKLSEDRFTQLHKALSKAGFVAMQSDNPEELFSYLKEKLSVRYTLKNEPVPEMELKFAKDRLDEVQIQSRTKIPLTGLDVWFGSIDMNIAFKEELLKSPKDMDDAKHLRTVYSEHIDESEIRNIKKMIKRHRL